MKTSLAFVVGLGLAFGQSGAVQAPAGKTAAETFKNLQVLGDLQGGSSPELWDTMQVMAGSLSVSCNYCHVAQAGPYESDANKTKLIARNMIRMTRAINDANFGGRLVVTCNTCHQGSPHPKPKPTPWNRTAEQIAGYSQLIQSRASGSPSAPPRPGGEMAETLPDVDQVIANYRRAVGTQALKSVHLSGIAADLNRGSRPRDVYVVFPDKIAIIASSAQQIVNGDRGWQVSSQGKTEMTRNAIANIKSFAASLLPVKYETSEVPRKVTGTETIADRAY